MCIQQTVVNIIVTLLLQNIKVIYISVVCGLSIYMYLYIKQNRMCIQQTVVKIIVTLLLQHKEVIYIFLVKGLRI